MFSGSLKQGGVGDRMEPRATLRPGEGAAAHGWKCFLGICQNFQAGDAPSLRFPLQATVQKIAMN